MTRVSTAGLFSVAVLAINNAQQNLDKTGQQADSGKIASDLAGYGGSAEQITASRTVQSRIQSYLTNGQVLSGKLDIQDQSLQAVQTAAGSAKTAISSAVAAGDGSSLITALQSALSSTVTALNTQYNGQYVFAGSQTSTAPVAASQLSDLTAAGAIANVFRNDQSAPTNRINDNTVVTTGQVASNVATPLLSALQQVEAFNQGPNGPITGTLTAAQTTFLQGVLASFTSAQTTVTSAVVQNGAVQSQLTNTTATLTSQNDSLTNTLSNLTDVNEAQVATQLQMAQYALQASVQVYNTLKASSLLNLTSSTATSA